MVTVIVRLLLAKITGCGAGSWQGKFNEIEDDPDPCPVYSHGRPLQTHIHLMHLMPRVIQARHEDLPMSDQYWLITAQL
jgi:hypothetical protein